MTEQFLLLVAGAGLTLLGAIVKTWLDRGSHSIARIFELRIEALNQIWQAFNELKGLYAARIQTGFQQWQSESADAAREALSRFRRAIDNAQVVLPAEVIDILRKLDGAYFLYHDNEDEKSGEFQRNVKGPLDELAAAVNATMGKRTHKMNLSLRT